MTESEAIWVAIETIEHRVLGSFIEEEEEQQIMAALNVLRGMKL